jgi:hypothetical protein
MMTDTDRTLLVLAMSCIVLTYAACVLVIEGLRELRTALRKWRVRRELQKDNTRVVGEWKIQRRQDLPQSGNGR